MPSTLKNGAVTLNRYGYRFNGKGPYQRVSTIKEKLSSGNGLVDWAAKMVAERAAAIGEDLAAGRIDLAAAASLLQDDSLRQAHNQVRDTAADFGTLFHSLVDGVAAGDQDILGVTERAIRGIAIQQHAKESGAELADERAERIYAQRLSDSEAAKLGGLERQIHARLWPDVEAFLDWADRMKPVWNRSEFQLFSDTYNYAGSADADITLGGDRVLVDVKTSKSVYSSYALQLAAYRYAEFIGLPSGEKLPVPEFTRAAVLHVRDGQCRLLELDAGREVFDAFLACWRLYWFDRNSKDSVVPFQVSLPVPSADDLQAVFA